MVWQKDKNTQEISFVCLSWIKVSFINSYIYKSVLSMEKVWIFQLKQSMLLFNHLQKPTFEILDNGKLQFKCVFL